MALHDDIEIRLRRFGRRVGSSPRAFGELLNSFVDQCVESDELVRWVIIPGIGNGRTIDETWELVVDLVDGSEVWAILRCRRPRARFRRGTFDLRTELPSLQAAFVRHLGPALRQQALPMQRPDPEPRVTLEPPPPGSVSALGDPSRYYADGEELLALRRLREQALRQPAAPSAPAASDPADDDIRISDPADPIGVPSPN